MYIHDQPVKHQECEDECWWEYEHELMEYKEKENITQATEGQRNVLLEQVQAIS